MTDITVVSIPAQAQTVVSSPVTPVTVTVGLVGLPGPPGESGAGTPGDKPVFIQPTQPTEPGGYLWLQTGLGGGNGFTLWFEDGL
jgi:hypothetical protein